MMINEICKTLRNYMIYVEKVRMYAKTMTLENAVKRAIQECIAENVLVDFVSTNRVEAKNVTIYEYDEEKHMKQIREER